MKLTKLIPLTYFIAFACFVACDDDESIISPPEVENKTEITVSTSDFSSVIDENPSADQLIGTVQGTTNEGTVTYSILSQSQTGALQINPTTGALTVADIASFDFEINPQLTATVQVANGAVAENASITIDLNNLVLTDEEGLMAFYPFDDDDVNGTTALDVSKYARHGSVNNAQLVADRWDDYNTSKAYSFGYDSYITLPDFGTDLSTFTISAWVYDNGSQSGYRCIASKAGAGREYVFRINSDPCACLGAHFTSGSNGLHTGQPFESGSWKHLVMVYDNATVKIYEDAVIVANKTSMNPINWGSNAITIGALKASGSENWFGEIDEVAFFERVLTQEEIQILSGDRGI